MCALLNFRTNKALNMAWRYWMNQHSSFFTLLIPAIEILVALRYLWGTSRTYAPETKLQSKIPWQSELSSPMNSNWIQIQLHMDYIIINVLFIKIQGLYIFRFYLKNLKVISHNNIYFYANGWVLGGRGENMARQMSKQFWMYLVFSSI